jgi:hypothetical protein
LRLENYGYEHIKEPREFLAIAFERARRLENLRKFDMYKNIIGKTDLKLSN